MRYRHKPTIITAIKYTGQNLPDVQRFLGYAYHHYHSKLFIKTPEGPMKASAGDWIVRGIQGEFYPVKPEVFEASYEPYNDGN